MANPQRGEIAVELDGRNWTLCLTLGGLAELEAHFGAADLTTLARRFSTGLFAAGDIIAIIHAGLVGGGHDLTREEVAQMRSSSGAAGYAGIVANLLAASFGQAGNGAAIAGKNHDHV